MNWPGVFIACPNCRHRWRWHPSAVEAGDDPTATCLVVDCECMAVTPDARGGKLLAAPTKAGGGE